MSYYEDWNNLIKNQTDDSIGPFWKEYSSIERRIYSDLLDHPGEPLRGSFRELQEKYDADPVIFTGFLDGIQESLRGGQLELENVDDDTEINFDVDLELLYQNMLKAEAAHLYELPQWDDILGAERKRQITRDYKRSKTVVKPKKIGRNDPCPCGSGKKYKYCCGRTA
ncbi:MAG: SEC-C metal-binding domain-containing protein [Anaerovoracaceae bacterium]